MASGEYVGRIKFYSKDKGFGFIGSSDPLLKHDTWFHVASTRGDVIPEVGDKVVITIDPDVITKDRYVATKIVIIREEKKPETNVLLGFPIIRGSGIRGFVVKEDLGHVTTEDCYAWAAKTSIEARAKLKDLAERRGGNAVFFHKTRAIYDPGTITSIWNRDPRFVCEGNVVRVEPVK